MTATIQANVNVPTVVIHTPLDSTAKLNYTYRNKFINGDFSVWQRGVNLALASPEYTADRWYATIVGAVTRQAFSAGESELLDNDEYYLRLTPAAYGTVSLQQRIEDVRTLAGKQVTLTFWARATGGTTLTATATQDFGSGGSIAVVTPLGTATLLTSWSKHTITLTLPSVASKTIGTGGDHFVAIKLEISAATIDLAHIQLEQGPLATDFEKKPAGEELRLAKRYYEQMDFAEAMRVPLIGQCSSSTKCPCVLNYATKRIAPISMNPNKIIIPPLVQLLDAAASSLITAWDTITVPATKDSAEVIGQTTGLITGYVAQAKAGGATAISIDAEL